MNLLYSFSLSGWLLLVRQKVTFALVARRKASLRFNLLVGLLASSSVAFARAPAVVWDHLGGAGSDALRSTVATPDGGYLLAGTSESGPTGDKSEAASGNDYWVVKLNGTVTPVTKDVGVVALLKPTSACQLTAREKITLRLKNFTANSQTDFKVGVVVDGRKIVENVNRVLPANGSLLYTFQTRVDLSREGLHSIVAYTALAGDQVRSNDTLRRTVTHYPKPRIVLSGDVTICPGTSTQLTASGGERYQWSTGDTTSTIRVSPQQTTVYSVTVTNAYGCQAVGKITVGVATTTTVALAPAKAWDKTLGGSGLDNLESVVATADGGYLLGGSSESGISSDKTQASRGASDYWVVKVDGQGNRQWDKTLGGSGNDFLYSVVVAPDGGYLLAGRSASGISGDKSENRDGNLDYWLVKLDGLGNKQWDQTLGGYYNNYLSSVVVTADGGYLLVGSSDSNAGGDKSENGKGGEDYWLIKINGNGIPQWDRTLGGSGRDELHSAVATADGGYLLGGFSTSGIGGDKSEASRGGLDTYDYWLVKISGNGIPQWDRTLGGNGADNLATVLATPDGGYLLAGSSTSGISGDKTQAGRGKTDYWVIKTDDRGNPQWDRTLGGDGDDYPRSVVATPDGGYLLAGTSYSGIGGDKSEDRKGYGDYWVIKIDGQGNKQWDRTLGGEADNGAYSAVATADGGYLVAGYSNAGISGDKSEANRGDSDYWLVKLDGCGNKQWDRTLGGSGRENLSAVVATADGGYLLAGTSASGISGDKTGASRGENDYWVVKLNPVANGPAARVAGNEVAEPRTGPAEIRVYPIPASHSLTVDLTADQADEVELVVTDVLSKSVLRTVRPVKAGSNELELSVSDLPSGVYFLRVNNGQRTVVRRIVLAR